MSVSEKRKSQRIEFSFLQRNEFEQKKILFPKFSELVRNSWGEFPSSKLIKYLFDADLVIRAQSGDELVGISEYKRLIDPRNGQPYYSLGISVIRNEWKKNSLNVILNTRLIMKAYIDNLFRNRKLTLDLQFVTGNVNFLLIFSKFASFLYPDPRFFDIKKNRLEISDKETWIRARDYVHYYGDMAHKLNREGCVLVGSLDDMPWLAFPINFHKSFENNPPEIIAFIRKYIFSKRGPYNEFVVRVKLNLFSIAQFFLLRTFHRL